MRAMTVVPGRPDSAEVTDVAEPAVDDGSVLVTGLFLGICGTDLEIVRDGTGRPPPGEERLVLGHESLGRVVSAPAGGGLSAGDLVMGVVRRPDPEPCPACARGEWDTCRNGRYHERGINGAAGYGAERWRVDPAYAIPVPDELGDLGVLVEPMSVVAKAWEQVDRVGSRSWFEPRRALVTGAGPIGLLATLLGVQRGLQVNVLDRPGKQRKPQLVADLGARYLTDLDQLDVEPDVVVETTGRGELVLAAGNRLAPAGVLCLVGLSPGDAPLTGVTGLANRLVMGNRAVVGSVNAGWRHYADAVDALLAADRGWLGALLTRRVTMAEWPSALERGSEDVKVVVGLQD